MADWVGRVAFITGAGSGIGAGLARQALKLGMSVYAADLDEEGLAQLAAGQEALPGTIHTLRLDVADAAAVEAAAVEVFAQQSQVNLLFNNAGVLVDGKSWERSVDDWRWSLDVNVMGVVHGLRSFVPRMLAQGEPGRVINTSSIGGLLGGGPFLAPYQGTKHCIAAMTESLYQELSLEAAPVTASLLCPGEVDTGIWESDRLRPEAERNRLGSTMEEQFHQAVAGQVAAGLTPDEFAERVFEGIEMDRFWLLPQPEFKALFQQRVDCILNETPPPSLAAMFGPD